MAADIKTPWIETPLIRSANLSRIAGCNIFLKLENLQPSGSFKSRGVGNFMVSKLLSHLSSPSPSPSPTTTTTTTKPHFFISSGGNAGLGCVHAAVTLGCQATVVVPLSTKPHMIEKLRQAGATEVIQRGESWKEADDHLRTVAMPEAAEKKPGEPGVYVHPFDHPEVWEGNAGITREVARQVGEMGRRHYPGTTTTTGVVDAIICSVGGGGLFSGVMQGLDELEMRDTTKVVAMETLGADSLSQAVKKGELVTLPAITSIATSLGARTVCERAFEYGMRGDQVTSVVLTDEQAMEGCRRFANEERLMVEAACGVCPALIYTGGLAKAFPGLKEDSNVVIVVCGGSNISLEMLREI